MEMEADTRTWLVEARVVLRSPHQVSEESRHDFFHAISSIAGDAGPQAEVRWAGDDTAFLAVSCRARTAQRAAESLRTTIKTRATAGARWRLSAGLRVDVTGVRAEEL